MTRIYCGLEFHQMLDTEHKLFCNCPTILRREKPDFTFRRRLRPTRSELGEVDPAALFEFKKGYTFVYEAYEDSTCLVEMDEEPPHDLNREAIQIALTIALMLKSRPVDEIHVMRKIVIDGSNTTGFQRTALIATGGEVWVDGKRVGIQTICLEEDAARKIGENPARREIVYRLDRLGIPLIEIATEPAISSPEEAERVALKIGQLLRMTGKVKRGLGTIRQDLNISVEGGARVEIKGVQKLELIKKVVEYEIQRQLKLLEIRDELKRRGIREDEILDELVDVTDAFANTKSKVIARVLSRGGKVLAAKLPGFAGLVGKEIQPGRRLGSEFADRDRFWGGVGGIIHSDELPGYGIGEEEVEEVGRRLGCGDLDAFVLVADEEERARRALLAVLERAREALKGVPNETRAANPDGTTRFSRPLPGRARMYPETDIRPVRITQEMIESAKKAIPESPEEKLRKFVEVYGLEESLAKIMINSYYLDLFERIVEEVGAPATLVASTLEGTLKSLRRDGVPVENLRDEHLVQVFRAVSRGDLAKEAIPEVLKYLSENPERSVGDAVKELGLEKIGLRELERLVERIVERNTEVLRRRRERAFGAIMGEVMKLVRGKVDGKVVSEIVEKKLRERLAALEA